MAQTLKLPYVAVEVGSGDDPAETVHHPPERNAPNALADLPLVHQGETVGRLRLAAGPSGGTCIRATLPLAQIL